MRQTTHGLFPLFAVGALLAPVFGTAAQKRAIVPVANRAVTEAAIDRAAEAILPRVVAWRRDFHEHPELGNREFRTGKIVADELTLLPVPASTASRDFR